MPPHDSSRPQTSPRWPRLLAAVAWCGLIAGTSSTVISPHDLFAWVATHTSTDGAVLRRFVTFWGYSWFVIVKGWHVAEFAILFALTHAVLRRLFGPETRRSIVPAAILCLLFALSDEFHQTFVPGRGGTLRDVAIDSLGIGLAATIAWSRRHAPFPLDHAQ